MLILATLTIVGYAAAPARFPGRRVESYLCRHGLAPLIVLCMASVLGAAEAPGPTAEPPASSKPAPPQRVVAARVNGHPIYADQVTKRIERVLGPRKIEPDARPLLEAETLEQLIERRLVLQFLAKYKLGASEQDLDAELTKVERQLAQQNLTLDEYLKRTQQTRDDLRETLRWDLSWRQYLEQQLTDENLKKFFDQHRRDFDGTELRAAHILLKPTRPDDPAAVAEAIAKAEEIRAAIASGATTFAEAAKKYSLSPTADQGGDIGWIGRYAPMPEPFAQAAFALEEGKVSAPVVTPFGVHLIQVLEAKPGDKTWSDVRPDLAKAVTAYLFDWSADQQRPSAQVEYTGALPHFKPGTKQLAK